MQAGHSRTDLRALALTAALLSLFCDVCCVQTRWQCVWLMVQECIAVDSSGKQGSPASVRLDKLMAATKKHAYAKVRCHDRKPG